MSSSPHRSTTAVPALEQARANYELALAYDPATAGWPGLHLGRLLYLSGDLRAAAEALRASIASGHVAYAPIASYHLGRLHEELGDTQAAIVAYREAGRSEDPISATHPANARGWRVGAHHAGTTKGFPRSGRSGTEDVEQAVPRDTGQWMP